MVELKFPISIALVGAPGSNKKATADAFVEIAGPFFAENDQKIEVIANAGGQINDEYQVAMGLFGDYSQSLRAFFLRYEQEEALRRAGTSFITCGTVIEHMAHSGIKIEDIRTGIQTPDVEQRLMKEMHATTVMSFLFFDTFRYTFGFYLPLPEKTVIVPGADEAQNSYHKRVDLAIQNIQAGVGLRIQAFDEPSPEARAVLMLETVERIMRDGPDKIVEGITTQAETTAEVTSGEVVTVEA